MLDYKVTFFNKRGDPIGSDVYKKEHYETMEQVNNDVWALVESCIKSSDKFLVLYNGAVKIESIEYWKVGYQG